MTGNVDKAEIAQVRESEVDRNAAAFFFFQTIRVDARECADQRCLAVVDVSGGAYDERNMREPLLKTIGR
jgi:hypothetical protein